MGGNALIGIDFDYIPDSGLARNLVESVLGHTSIGTTEKYYHRKPSCARRRTFIVIEKALIRSHSLSMLFRNSKLWANKRPLPYALPTVTRIKPSFFNGSKEARTPDLSRVRRTLIPAELCFLVYRTADKNHKMIPDKFHCTTFCEIVNGQFST